MYNMFDNVINEDALRNLPDEALQEIADILSVYAPKPIYIATDGCESVTIYQDRGGFITCDNYPDDRMGLAYWDCYADILSFACDYNPQLDTCESWLEDMNGQIMEDEDW